MQKILNFLRVDVGPLLSAELNEGKSNFQSGLKPIRSLLIVERDLTSVITSHQLRLK